MNGGSQRGLLGGTKKGIIYLHLRIRILSLYKGSCFQFPKSQV